jgi:uncharacterized protein (DUF169 family)
MMMMMIKISALGCPPMAIAIVCKNLSTSSNVETMKADHRHHCNVISTSPHGRKLGYKIVIPKYLFASVKKLA